MQTTVDHIAPRCLGGDEGFASFPNPVSRITHPTLRWKRSPSPTMSIRVSAALVWIRTLRTSNHPSIHNWFVISMRVRMALSAWMSFDAVSMHLWSRTPAIFLCADQLTTSSQLRASSATIVGLTLAFWMGGEPGLNAAIFWPGLVWSSQRGT